MTFQDPKPPPRPHGQRPDTPPATARDPIAAQLDPAPGPEADAAADPPPDLDRVGDPGYRHQPTRPAERVAPPASTPWPAARLVGVLAAIAVVVLILVLVSDFF